MTSNLKPFLNILFIYILFVMFFAWILYGCSAEYHMKKAVDKGFVLNVKIDTVKIPYFVTLKIKGKDTTLIQYKDSLIYQTKTEYVPKWRYRFDNKRFADSLAHIRAMYQDSLKNALKSQKVEARKDNKTKKQTRKVIQSENKNGFADSMKWIAIILFLLIIAYFLFKWELKDKSNG